MTTTKAKLEFTHAMARHTRATVRQCEALMRYAATLQRLAEDDCNVATDGYGLAERADKRLRIKQEVTDMCKDIAGFTGKDSDTCSCGALVKAHSRLNHSPRPIAQTGTCLPVFSGDPRGAVLKIRVPDGYTNDWGREGIVVPS